MNESALIHPFGVCQKSKKRVQKKNPVKFVLFIKIIKKLNAVLITELLLVISRCMHNVYSFCAAFDFSMLDPKWFWRSFSKLRLTLKTRDKNHS